MRKIDVVLCLQYSKYCDTNWRLSKVMTMPEDRYSSSQIYIYQCKIVMCDSNGSILKILIVRNVNTYYTNNIETDVKYVFVVNILLHDVFNYEMVMIDIIIHNMLNKLYIHINIFMTLINCNTFSMIRYCSIYSV